MGGNMSCRACAQEMQLVLAAPNPLVFPCWLDNRVLAVWACETHAELSSLVDTCAKFG
jgi:hypothetical protein